MSSKKKNIYIYLGKVILITLLIVLCIRCFFIESFTVSSSQMENTLLRGDRILIDKTAYGIRLPVTLLSIPFTFDNIGGVRSYSTAIQLPYKRLFSGQVEQNEVVLFNNPVETDKPLDKRSLLLSRCVALPGDMIQFRHDSLFVNEKLYKLTPNRLGKYMIVGIRPEALEQAASEFDIPLRGFHTVADTSFLELDDYEQFILKDNLPDSLTIRSYARDSISSNKIIIPSKGKAIDLNEENLLVYGQIILQELGNAAKIENGQLLIEGTKQDKYTFDDDYYWMLSDNVQNSLDSRTLGFIPFKSIIGKARFVWYSSDTESRQSRCFKSISNI